MYYVVVTTVLSGRSKVMILNVVGGWLWSLRERLAKLIHRHSEIGTGGKLCETSSGDMTSAKIRTTK